MFYAVFRGKNKNKSFAIIGIIIGIACLIFSIIHLISISNEGDEMEKPFALFLVSASSIFLVFCIMILIKQIAREKEEVLIIGNLGAQNQIIYISQQVPQSNYQQSQSNQENFSNYNQQQYQQQQDYGRHQTNAQPNPFDQQQQEAVKNSNKQAYYNTGYK